jgi:deazaflavin-dependent oxidoreductase (nitroreductase family)
MVPRVFMAGGTGAIGRRRVPQFAARDQVPATTTKPGGSASPPRHASVEAGRVAVHPERSTQEGATHMSDRIDSAASVPAVLPTMPPRWVLRTNFITKFLLAAGVPLGVNGLITIRGRKSGLPRTTPVSIIEVSGRRWIWAPWGDVQWVRNLRAAGRATITFRRRSEEVTATELDAAQRVGYFRDVYFPFVRGIGRWFVWFIRTVDRVDVDRSPEEAAEGRRVFELYPLR